MKYLTLGLILTSCTSWRGNTSVDLGVGSQSLTPGQFYGYVGASYYVGAGVSVTGGAWRTLEGYTGPYGGINYSFTPFD